MVFLCKSVHEDIFVIHGYELSDDTPELIDAERGLPDRYASVGSLNPCDVVA